MRPPEDRNSVDDHLFFAGDVMAEGAVLAAQLAF